MCFCQFRWRENNLVNDRDKQIFKVVFQDAPVKIEES